MLLRVSLRWRLLPVMHRDEASTWRTSACDALVEVGGRITAVWTQDSWLGLQSEGGIRWLLDLSVQVALLFPCVCCWTCMAGTDAYSRAHPHGNWTGQGVAVVIAEGFALGAHKSTRLSTRSWSLLSRYHRRLGGTGDRCTWFWIGRGVATS